MVFRLNAGGPALITGASGFLGRHLCRVLRARGETPLLLSRRAVSPRDEAAGWRRCDLLDAERLHALVRAERPSCIYHLGGFASADSSLQGMRDAFDANVRGTANVLFAAASHDTRVLAAGTLDASCVHSDGARYWTAYGATKQMASLAAGMTRELLGADVVIVRIGNAYGPDEPNERRLVPHVILSLLGGKAPALSSGLRRCDWIYVDDVAEALVRIGTHGGALPPRLDVGTGMLTSVRDVARTLGDLVGVDLWPRLGVVPDRPGDGEPANLALIREAIGWAPPTQLAAGLARTVEWYRARAQLYGSAGAESRGLRAPPGGRP